jgi:hypothetical protein
MQAARQRKEKNSISEKLEAHTLKPESSNDALERKNLWTFRYTVAKK